MMELDAVHGMKLNVETIMPVLYQDLPFSKLQVARYSTDAYIVATVVVMVVVVVV